ncbi:hypothetical protein E2C01_036163 [Portunus trituberculatus]|uniref:Uncharacterized protein n=1 Tax=Portunus trituberculatus TaxID=210409 RepID=A0A5B7F518_PORTR|nr:hypothetical protein [Portunus trituberculatus]
MLLARHTETYESSERECSWQKVWRTAMKLLQIPVHVIQLEWPWSTDAVGLDGAAYDESLLEAALQNGQENWTHPAGSLSFPGNSHDASHHPHRFK